MGANPFLGVIFHWLGGLASGSFYVPYKGVRKWSWEVYWLVGGFFSWIICPWVIAGLMTHGLLDVVKQQSGSTLWWTYFFGAMWGFGGLTFGLTMRYLGMSLGMGVALGYCAAFGTLMPPILKALMPNIPVASSIIDIAKSTSGQVILAGVVVCLVGIAIAALAGWTKEKEMPEEQKKVAIKEFNFRKGILVATFSGIMSACFAFALQAGNPIKVDALKACYIFGATSKGIHVIDKGVLPAAVANQFLQKLDPAVLGLAPDQKLDSGSLLANLETNAPFAGKFAAQYSGSTDPVAQRLTAYATGFATVRDHTAVATTIRSLEDFSQREVAVNIAQAGGDVIALQKRYGLWQGLPPLVVLLLGGFTTNFIWCVILNIKNRTGYEYFSATLRHPAPSREQETIIETAMDAPSEEVVEHAGKNVANASQLRPEAAPASRAVGHATVYNPNNSLAIPLLPNYLFSALAGTTWYFQFFFYTMGATQMGKYDFASWTLHMASIIIFSTIWGVILHEWKGSSKKAHLLIAGGIATLVLSTAIIGAGAGWTDLLKFLGISK